MLDLQCESQIHSESQERLRQSIRS